MQWQQKIYGFTNMTWKFIVVVWLIYVAVNICIAELNDKTRRKRIANKTYKQINHPLWAAIYCALCAIPIYISRSWIEALSILLLHISIFPVAFNRFSDLPAFHLSPTSTAITDDIMRRLKLKSTEEVNIIAFYISVILLFIQIFVK